MTPGLGPESTLHEPAHAPSDRIGVRLTLYLGVAIVAILAARSSSFVIVPPAFLS